MKKLNARVRHAGFVMQELLIGLVIVAVLAGLGIFAYNSMRGDIAAEDQGNKLVAMVAEIQKQWRQAQNYGTLTPTALSQLRAIEAPMRLNGTNLLDAWGNTMSVSGGTTSFALTVGGATAPISNDTCADLVTRLSTVADQVRVGTAATVGSGATAGQITGGNFYKSGAATTQTAMITGCNEASPVVAVMFR